MGILEQSDITLVSLTDTTLQEEEVTLTEEEEEEEVVTITKEEIPPEGAEHTQTEVSVLRC